MAVKKTTGSAKEPAKATAATAAKDVHSAHAEAKSKSAAKAKTHDHKAAPALAKPETADKAAAPKKAAPKKAAPPVTLAKTHAELLQKIGDAGDAGFLTSKKVELRTIEALRERKLVKRGLKDKASGHYHVTVSNAGKKHLDSQAAAHAPAAHGAATPPPHAGGNA